MQLTIVFIGALAALACISDAKETTANKETTDGAEKEKRQTEGEVVVAAPAHYVYRAAGRQQYERVADVREPQVESAEESSRIAVKQDYRPGQVISIGTREFLEIQPERKASYVDRHNLQQIYQDIQTQQVALQPSHTVIARPPSSASGGEVSVGAALSVSDSGTDAYSLDSELLTLLGHAPIRQAAAQSHETTSPMYTRYQSEQKPVPTYSQDKYIPKPTKSKPKIRTKTTTPVPPQQYLIETTNPQTVRPAQSPRPAQNLRYVTYQPVYDDRPEAQALSIVAAPKLQQRPAYRFISQPQAEAAQKQYRIVPEAAEVQKKYRIVPESLKSQEPKQQEQQFRYVYSPPVERPITYLKRYQVKPEEANSVERYVNVPAQLVGDQYYIRPEYRQSAQRGRYDLAHLPLGSADASRIIEPQAQPQQQNQPLYTQQEYQISPKYEIQPQYHSRPKYESQVQYQSQVEYQNQPKYPVQPQHHAQPKYQTQQKYHSQTHYQPKSMPAHSAIYVSMNALPKKTPTTSRPPVVSIENPGSSLEEQRARLPPPKNNKAYTPEEFAGLVAAGYSVTPIPVHDVAESRSAPEPIAASRRQHYGQRTPQYLPFRGDDAP